MSIEVHPRIKEAPAKFPILGLNQKSSQRGPGRRQIFQQCRRPPRRCRSGQTQKSAELLTAAEYFAGLDKMSG